MTITTRRAWATMTPLTKSFEKNVRNGSWICFSLLFGFSSFSSFWTSFFCCGRQRTVLKTTTVTWCLFSATGHLTWMNRVGDTMDLWVFSLLMILFLCNLSFSSFVLLLLTSNCFELLQFLSRQVLNVNKTAIPKEMQETHNDLHQNELVDQTNVDLLVLFFKRPWNAIWHAPNIDAVQEQASPCNEAFFAAVPSPLYF